MAAPKEPQKNTGGYRSRIAPTPTGLLHLGHAHTFRCAWQRARAAGGTLIYREENLDPLRCNDTFAKAAMTDLRRYGLDWDEGPDCTPKGPHTPYRQSERFALYRAALAQLIRSGHAYPDAHSRSDLNRALQSGLARPSPPLTGEQDTEAIFPPSWRPADHEWFANAAEREHIARMIAPQSTAADASAGIAASAPLVCATKETPTPNTSAPPFATAPAASPQDFAQAQHTGATASPQDSAHPFATDSAASPQDSAQAQHTGATAAEIQNTESHAAADSPAPVAINPADVFGKNSVNWRFRVPDGHALRFNDGNFGAQSFTAGDDFGDFTLWRRDGVPAYELAVVADDIAMGITEVVRGADLLRSTARQLLLYRSWGASEPEFYHCTLVLDPQTGNRLAKRSDALSLRTLLDRGLPPLG